MVVPEQLPDVSPEIDPVPVDVMLQQVAETVR